MVDDKKNNNKKRLSRSPIGRKGTMDQTINDAKNFLSEGTYDAKTQVEKTSVLGKRKRNPVKKFEVEVSPSKPRSKSKSPIRKKRKTVHPSPIKTPKKKRNVRSVSPKKTSTRRAVKKVTPTIITKTTTPTPLPSTPLTVTNSSPSGLQLPILWEFQSNKPAFGVHVSQGRCWMSNDDGNVYGFTLDGKMERNIKLPTGIKSVVSDMGMWLYAGCDNGIVYDLSNEEQPREAYQVKDYFDNKLDEEEDKILNAIDNVTEEDNNNNTNSSDNMDIDLSLNTNFIKPRHIIFVIDKSSSMSGNRIQEVANNLRMIYDYHLRDGDYISLITFDHNISSIFKRLEKGNNTEDKKLRDFIFSPNFTYCSGATAFFDSIGVAFEEFENRPDEEQWIIALTDGWDNRSTKYNETSICNLVKTNSQNVNVVNVYISQNSNIDSYGKTLSNICSNSAKGLFINANSSSHNSVTGGITQAFKQIAQVLSSKIMWMDIRDGLLTVSDRSGSVIACSIEGNPIWQKKSSGTCGWMVRSDFEGVYHGHSVGVTKYSPMDGNMLWEHKIEDRLLFGWMDKTTKMLFIAAGSSIYQISCSEGKRINKFICDDELLSTTASFGSDRIFGADKYGFIYCFSSDGKREWKLATNRGAALSMHFSDDKLFIVTTLGYLLCIDVNTDNIKSALKDLSTKTIKQAEIPKDIKVILPDNSIEETDTIGNGIVVEIYQEFSDDDLLKISQNIHNKDIQLFTINGREYSIEKHKNGCRCVKINGILYIEQNTSKTSSKYAKMAKNGDKITWVCNSGKWGLIINDKVHYNGTRLLCRPKTNDKGFETTKNVQFPKNLRTKGANFVVEQLIPSESNEFYRIQGSIKLLKTK